MKGPTITPWHVAMAARVAAAHPLTAHGIKRTGPAKVSGAHLSDAANEPGDFARIEAEANAEARAIVAGRNGDAA